MTAETVEIRETKINEEYIELVKNTYDHKCYIRITNNTNNFYALKTDKPDSEQAYNPKSQYIIPVEPNETIYIRSINGDSFVIWTWITEHIKDVKDDYFTVDWTAESYLLMVMF